MNRLGMPEREVEQLAASPELLSAFETTLVMSHLACADHADDPMNERQRQRFEALRAKLPPAPASLANSGGTFLGPRYHFDLVRPGIALYGGRAHEGKANPMQTVVRLAARILQVRDVGARRERSATAPPTRCRRPRASPPRAWAMPTGSCAP